MNRTIITVIGKDRVGIIARICTYLAENDINVLDINQSIVQGFFNMIMIVDAQNSKKDFAVLNGEIEKISEELGVKIKMQHEDIFNVSFQFIYRTLFIRMCPVVFHMVSTKPQA